MYTLKDLSTLTFPYKESLSVYSAPEHVPFPIGRVFVVQVSEACERGNHAHKACQQALVCLQGQCAVTVDDGRGRESFLLDHPSKGLFIPPTLWAEQTYDPKSILMVFADLPYDEADYIREYEEFLAWRKGS